MPLATDLTTLAALKLWLGISVTTDDALLSALVSSVSIEICQQIGRPAGLASATYTENRDGTGTATMALKNFPVTGVSSLLIDTVSVQSSPDGVQPGFVFDTFLLKLVGVPPYLNAGGPQQLFTAPWVFRSGKNNVVVNYTAGYAAIPLDLAQAATEVCALRYLGRKRVGLISSTSKAGESASYDLSRWPESAAYVIQTYRSMAPV